MVSELFIGAVAAVSKPCIGQLSYQRICAILWLVSYLLLSAYLCRIMVSELFIGAVAAAVQTLYRAA